MFPIEVFDIVELLEDQPEMLVFAGIRGTVLEILADGAAYLVEFSDQHGQGTLLTLAPTQIKLIWRNTTGEYLSAVDQLAAEVRYLSEDQAAELLGIVRALRKSAA